MQAKKCDRCGKFYELYDGFEIAKGGNKYNTVRLEKLVCDSIYRKFDLCPECMEKLVNFIKNER